MGWGGDSSWTQGHSLARGLLSPLSKVSLIPTPAPNSQEGTSGRSGGTRRGPPCAFPKPTGSGSEARKWGRIWGAPRPRVGPSASYLAGVEAEGAEEPPASIR